MLPREPRRWKQLAMVFSILVQKANPVLFSVIMGTGVISVLFSVFPYGKGTRGMMITSLVVFFLNLALCCTFTIFAIAKYVLYPDRWTSLISNPVTSLYLGTYPMGITTLINVAVEVIFTHFEFGGKRFLYSIWGVWWIDVVISALCCWVGVHAMMVRQQHSLTTVTATWLLPVVTLIVAASSGGVLATAMQRYSEWHALVTVITSIFLVSTGLTLALMVLTIYYARLIIHGLPPGASVLSVFLPLGPTGQSGYAICLLGRNFQQVLPYNQSGSSIFLSSTTTGEALYVLCISASFILWSLATMWMMFALLALRSTVFRSPVAFRMSFWGLIFPNGVYANLTILLGNSFDSSALRIYGSIYAIVVMCLWICIATRSLFALQDLVDPNNQLFKEAKGIRQNGILSSFHQSTGTSQTEIAIENGSDRDLR